MGEMSHSGQPQPPQMHEIRSLTNGIEIKSHETVIWQKNGTVKRPTSH